MLVTKQVKLDRLRELGEWRVRVTYQDKPEAFFYFRTEKRCKEVLEFHGVKGKIPWRMFKSEKFSHYEWSFQQRMPY